MFQPFIQQQKSVAFPVQCFQTVSSSSAKQEHGFLERIHLKLCFYDRGQTINSSTQVRVSAGYVDRAAAVKIVQHDFKIRSTVSMVAASAPT